MENLPQQTPPTPETDHADHKVAVALIQKDISNILKSIEKIDTKMDVYDRNFARKEETKAIQESIKTLDTDITKKIEEMNKKNEESLKGKVDNKDFDPIKTALSRINWMLIVAIVGGILSLIIKAGS